MLGVIRNVASAVAAVLLLFCCAQMRAQRHEHKRAERAEISLLEQEWRQAQVSDNIQEMDHLLAEDFLGITASGQVVTKAQQLERMRTRSIDLRRLDVVDTKIKISRNLAVVTSLAQIDGVMDGRPLQGSFRYTRVYQRAGSGNWRITNFEATRVPSAAVLHQPITPAAAVAGPRAGAASFLPASQAESGSHLPPS